MQDWLREKTGAGLGDSEMNHSLNPKPLNHKPSHPKPLNLNPPTVSRKENQSALSFTRCQETESRSPVRCHACRLRFDGSGMVWGFRSFWFRGLGIGVYLKSQTLPVIRNIPEKPRSLSNSWIDATCNCQDLFLRFSVAGLRLCQAYQRVSWHGAIIRTTSSPS